MIQPMSEQDQRITQEVKTNRKRLMEFIRQRVDNSADAEDVLQDVMSTL